MRPTAWPKPNRTPPGPPSCVSSPKNCRRVPAHPPKTFWQAAQFVWFTQLGGILSENPLALNPGRFDQYMDPYYEADLAAGRLAPDFAQELIEALWLKYSQGGALGTSL